MAGGFETVAAHFRRAAAAMPSWTGRAAEAVRETLEGLATAGDGCLEACLDAHAEVLRYAHAFREAHERVKRLREEAEEAKRERDRARRLAGEAGKRAGAARTRAAGALVGAPFDAGGLAMAEHRRALREAEEAEDDQARLEMRAKAFHEELVELRQKAARERQAAREAEDRAESQVLGAEGRFPAIPTVAGGAPALAGGQAGWPFAGPLLPDGAFFGRPLEPRPGEGEDQDDGGPLEDAWDWASGAASDTANAGSGLTHELSFGLVDLGGDKDSGAYKAGEVASYVPWNPASALKSAGTGALKVGGKIVGKKAAGEGAETAAKRNLDELGGAGGRGGGHGRPDVLPVPPPKRWGPHNGPGPLGEGYAKTFRSASYTERTLEKDMYLYRAWGGKSGEMSRFWSADPPAGPLQAKMDSALPPGNTAEHMTAVRVPAGTKVYEGAVAPGFGRPGGGSQVVLEGQVPREWVVRTERGYAPSP